MGFNFSLSLNLIRSKFLLFRSYDVLYILVRVFSTNLLIEIKLYSFIYLYVSLVSGRTITVIVHRNSIKVL